MLKKFFNYLVNLVKGHKLFLFHIFSLLLIVLLLLASCQGLFNVNVKDSDAKVSVIDSFKGGE